MEGLPRTGGGSRPDSNLVSRTRSFIRARPVLRAVLVTLVVFCFLLLPAWWVAGVWYEDHLVTEARVSVSSEVSIAGNRLSQALNQRVALLEGLSAFVISDPSPDHLSRNFDPFAAGLYSGAPGIRNFAVAPGGVQTYVYPLKGNENVPGHNLLTDERPEVRDSVNRTIETRQTVLQGPYELRQGGLGLVTRKAVFVNGTFWGLVAMVVDMPPILEQAGLPAGSPGLTLAARNSEGYVFFGDPALFSGDAIVQQIPVGSGTWEVAGMPAGGWSAPVAGRITLFEAAGFVIIILLSLLVFFAALQGEDTRRVHERSIFELSPFWICCIYLAFGVVWILASDTLFTALFPDAGTSALAQSVKGLLFIILTALVLYALISHLSRELRTREQDLARVVEAGNVGLWDWDLATNKVLFSKEWKGHIGYDEHEISDDYSEWESRLHPDDLERMLRAARAFIDQSSPEYHVEFRFRHKDGSYRWILAKGSLLLDRDGKPVRMLGSHVDITRQKAYQESLRESEERYHLLVDESPYAIAIHQDGVVVFVNPFTVRMMGAASAAGLIGRPIRQFVHPDGWEAATDRIRRMLAGEKGLYPVEDRYVRLDGSVVPVEVIAAPFIFSGRPAIQIIASDITDRKRAEKALLESEENYRGISTNLPGVVYQFRVRNDGSSYFSYISPRATEVFGISTDPESPDWVLGARVHPDDREEFLASIGRAVAKAGPWHFEGRMLLPDGRAKWFEGTSNPVRIGDELVYNGLLLDITEKKAARVQIERQNRALLLTGEVSSLLVHTATETELLEQVCALITRGGGYRMAWIGYAEQDERKSVRPVASSGFEDGYLDTANITWADTERGRGPTGTAIRTGKHSIVRAIPGDPGYALWREAALRRGYQSSIALPLQKDGMTFGALNIYAAEQDAFNEDEVRLLLDLARDLSFGITTLRTRTLRLQAEEALREAHRDLEQKVVERTRELFEANLRLRELDRLKSMFIASMSHELRTPLNSIIGFTGIMIRGMAGELSPEQKKQLGMVRESARHLLGLINDIIDISKIEAEKIEPAISAFDLAPVLTSIRDSLASQAAEKGLAIDIAVYSPLPVTTDERRVRQVVTNLVSNAVKFTDRGSIAIRAVQTGDVVEVSVSDTGIGIREPDLRRLFQPFTRITDPARPTEGTGLGLYLSQKLARFLGGELRAESEYGWGSTFVFRFPREFPGGSLPLK